MKNKPEVHLVIDGINLHIRGLLERQENGKFVRKTKKEVVEEIIKGNIHEDTAWAEKAFDEMTKKLDEVEKQQKLVQSATGNPAASVTSSKK